MDGAECGIINDACVSMRVCFDSLCFSSTQHRLADEEDANQLANNNATTMTTTTTAATTPMAAGAATPAAAPAPNFPTSTSSNNNNNASSNNNSGPNTTTSTHQPSASNHNIDGLRDLQELIRMKDERITELETIVCRRDAEIQELRSHLDKFLSVLPFKSPLTPTKPRPRKQRAQGISAEPPLQQLAPLVFYAKSDRLVEDRFFFLYP